MLLVMPNESLNRSPRSFHNKRQTYNNRKYIYNTIILQYQVSCLTSNHLQYQNNLGIPLTYITLRLFFKFYTTLYIHSFYCTGIFLVKNTLQMCYLLYHNMIHLKIIHKFHLRIIHKLSMSQHPRTCFFHHFAISK